MAPEDTSMAIVACALSVPSPHEHQYWLKTAKVGDVLLKYRIIKQEGGP